ncbi:DUF2752 domain-containing protein [Marixanthomonas spongiae]|uniref:DUF2752 domain-containing protein n=1 Tax=Marixanthomonas spongiae TaxID=2174845 RepID=A0A2U0I2T0_9FLAO|nr:DUF2752 domain-containing protein [Marixanthomonas spongiae]PVW15300.1 DUF2752 domain-containing protein [Marixanthomonas spongiae]
MVIDKTTKLLSTVGFLGAVSMVFYLYNPVESSFFIPCPFHYLTGLHCPGCGSQRALHQLAHFNIYGAFRYNPLLVLSLPILFYSVGIVIYNFINQTKYRVSFFYNNAFIYAYFGMVVLFWVLRNVPYEPFTYLAPAG